MTALHPRAFTVTVVWTLLLLYLGSVVHATESSLACPDWPTCFGTFVPEMTGGVFWEHLHRLVAGGLLLMWGLATWLVRREAPERRGLFRAALAGLALLVVQSLFGGLTVLLLLPDLVSTTHLALALLFLALATALASRSKRTRSHDPDVARVLRGWGGAAAGMVFAQSVLGGLVRHMDAGMACPDAPLCLGQLVPPLDLNALVTVHFLHRAVGVLTAAVVVGLAAWAWLRAPAPARGWAIGAAALVLVQVGIGFLSVLTGLAVVPVSAHTLVAASLLAVLVHLTASGWATDGSGAHRAPAPEVVATRA
jgi:heme A synthase